MDTEELKQWADKEFDGKIKEILLRNFDNDKYLWSKADLESKSLLDSIIDKTVQMERERIVGMIREVTAYDHSKCPIKETCIGYQNCVSDIENGVIDALITNKNDINKDKE